MTPGSPGPSKAGEPAPVVSPTAIVVAGDLETRLLIRSLLRLSHVQVLGEAAGSTDGVDLMKSQTPSVLIADANLAEGSCSALVDAARGLRPAVRVVLLTPDRRRPVPNLGSASPDVVLTRPFRIQEFTNVLALGPAQPASTALLQN